MAEGHIVLCPQHEMAEGHIVFTLSVSASACLCMCVFDSVSDP